MSRNVLARLICCAPLAGLLAPVTALAQTADAPLQLEEIIVTARKLTERQQDVPVSVTAMSRATLDRIGAKDIGQLSNLVPGLSYDQDFGRRLDRPAIRGQSSILGTPNAASFLDGVFIPDSLFGTEMAFVDQVEVIKGPQSALYGRQTFSGAISYTSRKPSDVMEGQVKLTAAQHDEYNALAMISGPLVEDKLAFQLAGNYYTYGGEYRNNNPTDAYYRKKIGDEETKAVSGALLFTPNDNLDITLRYSYGKNEDGVDATVLQRASSNNCFRNAAGTAFQYYCGTVHATPDQISMNLGAVEGGGLTRETSRAAAIINYYAGDIQLTSITGYTDSDEDRKADLDFLPITGAGGTLHVRDGVYIESFSQEFRVSNDGADGFRWLAGAYMYDEDRATERYMFPTKRLQDNGTNTIRNYAGFALVNFDLTEALSAGAELRYAVDKLGLEGGDNRYNLSKTFKSWNPRFTLDYKFTDDVMAYGVAARGNKPGGFNSDVRLTGSQVYYDEESAWNYELGLKTDLLNRRLRLNVAAYYIDWKDQQLTQSAVFSTGSISYIANAGSLEVKGIEVEAQAALTEWWKLSTGISLNDPEYTSGTDAEVGRLTGNSSIKGKTAPNTPKYQFSVMSDFDTALTDEVDGFMNIVYTYRSKKYDQVGNFASTGSRDQLDARAGVTYGDYRATLFVKNLFDNMDPLGVIRYVDFGVTGSPRGYQVSLPRGRQVGVTLEAKF
ncbi:TonB-dependent receptor [Niveispirillum sp.]|uniref:TonB-dependent receptor n=1 Tax=Niveispirillum sp. TaxID=1917217 RepID=UPI001B400683|nr:TonB-dependent receptor [Niveispirillum sp.]MBP7335596.1 TonB-dependent receptor [Niveispirillum sp.]